MRFDIAKFLRPAMDIVCDIPDMYNISSNDIDIHVGILEIMYMYLVHRLQCSEACICLHFNSID